MLQEENVAMELKCRSFVKLIQQQNCPKGVFHSLRHMGITYKMKLTGGNIKAVRGDSGHSQPKMVTDLYPPHS